MKKLNLIRLSSEDARKPRWSDLFFQQPSLSLQRNSMKIIERGQIPIIIDRIKNGILDISRHQFAVGNRHNMGAIQHRIRRDWNPQDSSIALYFTVDDGTMVCSSTPLIDIYNEHKDSNGFLRICFTEESTFG